MEQDKIIGRLKKLLAMANDMTGTTEAERDTAMKMAHKLLVKHNLTMQDAENPIAEERVRDYFERGGNPWARSVIQSIADLYFCKFFFFRGIGHHGRDHNYFVGLASNVETAKNIARFVVDSVEKEANRVKRAKGEDAAYARAFCYGAAAQIMRRCGEIKAEAEKPTTNSQDDSSSDNPGTGLVLASLYKKERDANKAYLESFNIKLKEEKKKSRPVDKSGYFAGNEYGKSIVLNTQIKK